MFDRKNHLKVSTIAVVSAGDRMFVGTGDGSLTAHECRGDTTNALKAGSFECREVSYCVAPPRVPLPCVFRSERISFVGIYLVLLCSFTVDVFRACVSGAQTHLAGGRKLLYPVSLEC